MNETKVGMLSVTNVYSDTTVLATYNKEVLDFTIESIINRRLRDEVSPQKMFTILNAFLNFKGEEFKSKYFNLLKVGKNTILLEATKRDVYPLPLKIVHDVLDMFDFEEIKTFLRNTNYIKIPSKLLDVYDASIEIDERGSREQTYLKDEYVELIALITMLKSTTGLIGEYAAIKDTVLSKNPYKEYMLLTFYTTHPIWKNPAFVKMVDSVKKLINRLFNDAENTAIRIIEKTISRDSLPLYITSLVVIQKLLVNNELDDNDLKHTITKIYSFSTNNLKFKDSSSKYKIKHLSSADDGGAEQESAMESYRVGTKLTPGILEEYRNVFRDPYRVAKQLGIKANRKQISLVLDNFNRLKEPLPIEEAIYVVSWLYKDITDPRSFDYLLIDELINAMAIGYLYLNENGYEDIAAIISSFSSTESTFKLNFSLRNKLDNELRNGLIDIFKYERAIKSAGEVKVTSYIEDIVSVFSKSLMKYNLISVLDDELLLDNNRSVKVTENIKNRLSSLIIFINTDI